VKLFSGLTRRAAMTGAAFAVYFIPGSASACPPGFIPNAAGTPGVPCIPFGGQSQDDGGGNSGSSGMAWETRWGAFAYDEATSMAGVGGKMPSRGRAKKAALAHCQANGGMNCKVEFAYDNQCGALAIGKTSAGYLTRYYRSEVRLDDAEAGARKGCADQGGLDCQIILTDCSRPQRIQ